MSIKYNCLQSFDNKVYYLKAIDVMQQSEQSEPDISRKECENQKFNLLFLRK